MSYEEMVKLSYMIGPLTICFLQLITSTKRLQCPTPILASPWERMMSIYADHERVISLRIKEISYLSDMRVSPPGGVNSE